MPLRRVKTRISCLFFLLLFSVEESYSYSSKTCSFFHKRSITPKNNEINISPTKQDLFLMRGGSAQDSNANLDSTLSSPDTHESITEQEGDPDADQFSDNSPEDPLKDVGASTSPRSPSLGPQKVQVPLPTGQPTGRVEVPRAVINLSRSAAGRYLLVLVVACWDALEIYLPPLYLVAKLLGKPLDRVFGGLTRPVTAGGPTSKRKKKGRRHEREEYGDQRLSLGEMMAEIDKYSEVSEAFQMRHKLGNDQGEATDEENQDTDAVEKKEKPVKSKSGFFVSVSKKVSPINVNVNINPLTSTKKEASTLGSSTNTVPSVTPQPISRTQKRKVESAPINTSLKEGFSVVAEGLSSASEAFKKTRPKDILRRGLGVRSKKHRTAEEIASAYTDEFSDSESDDEDDEDDITVKRILQEKRQMNSGRPSKRPSYSTKPRLPKHNHQSDSSDKERPQPTRKEQQKPTALQHSEQKVPQRTKPGSGHPHNAPDKARTQPRRREQQRSTASQHSGGTMLQHTKSKADHPRNAPPVKEILENSKRKDFDSASANVKETQNNAPVKELPETRSPMSPVPNATEVKSALPVKEILEKSNRLSESTSEQAAAFPDDGQEMKVTDIRSFLDSKDSPADMEKKPEQGIQQHGFKHALDKQKSYQTSSIHTSEKPGALPIRTKSLDPDTPTIIRTNISRKKLVSRQNSEELDSSTNRVKFQGKSNRIETISTNKRGNRKPALNPRSKRIGIKKDKKKFKKDTKQDKTNE